VNGSCSRSLLSSCWRPWPSNVVPLSVTSFLQVKVETATLVEPNNDPEDFQFVIVSDRTGGHREKVFSRRNRST
jgi:hypothetical protein